MGTCRQKGEVAAQAESVDEVDDLLDLKASFEPGDIAGDHGVQRPSVFQLLARRRRQVEPGDGEFKSIFALIFDFPDTLVELDRSTR